MSLSIEDSFNSSGSDVKSLLNKAGEENIKPTNIGKSSVTIACLNTINAILGAGISSLPYTYHESGLILSISSIFFFALFFSLFSTKILIVWKEITGLSGYGAIGCEWYGRKGIFIILSIISIQSLITTSLFMINFATAVSPLIDEIFDINYFLTRLGIVVISGIMLFWFWAQRDIYNLRYASYSTLMWIIAFISILLLIFKIYYKRFTMQFKDILFPKSYEYYSLTIPNTFTVFWYHPLLFSLFSSLRSKTTENAMKFTFFSSIFVLIAYLLIGILSLFIFGSNVEDSFLNNISDSKLVFKHLLLMLYLVVSATHIPMVFFAGKEAMLNIYLELKSK